MDIHSEQLHLAVNLAPLANLHNKKHYGMHGRGLEPIMLSLTSSRHSMGFSSHVNAEGAHHR
jgi:hypothetical protein